MTTTTRICVVCRFEGAGVAAIFGRTFVCAKAQCQFMAQTIDKRAERMAHKALPAPQSSDLSPNSLKLKWYCGLIVAYAGNDKWYIGAVEDSTRDVEWFKCNSGGELHKNLDLLRGRMLYKTDDQIFEYAQKEG